MMTASCHVVVFLLLSVLHRLPAINGCGGVYVGDRELTYVSTTAQGTSTIAPSLALSASQMRLANGARGSQGRLEVLYNNMWGTVCDDSFNNKAAAVVCRTLGYTGSNFTARDSAYFGRGSGQIWLDDVMCDGTEQSLDACSKDSWGYHDCGHNEDVGVDCQPHLTQLPARLVNGSSPREGRVELKRNGTWGTVCDNGWNEYAAQVVCNQLNFTNSKAIPFGEAYYGKGTGTVMLHYVRCTGVILSLGDCAPITTNNCDHNEDAGVICIAEARTYGSRCKGLWARSDECGTRNAECRRDDSGNPKCLCKDMLEYNEGNNACRPVVPTINIEKVYETYLDLRVTDYKPGLRYRFFIDGNHHQYGYSEHVRLRGFIPGQQYNLTTKCSLGNEKSLMSDPVHVRMVPGQITSAYVVNRTSTSLTIRLVPQGEYDKFTVLLKCVSTNSNSQPAISASYVTLATTLTTDVLETPCTLNVTSHIADLTGRPKVLQLQTTEEAERPVQDLRVKSRHSKELTVVWSVPDNLNGVVRRYMVNIGASDCPCCDQYSFELQCIGMERSSQEQCVDASERPRIRTTRHIQCGKNMTFAASRLLPGRSYTVSVVGYTKCWGLPRNITRTTLEEAPSQAPTVDNVTSTDSSMFVSWSPPGCRGQNGIISSYNVKYTSPSDQCQGNPRDTSRTQQGNKTTDQTSLFIDDLLAFQQYTISVAAITRVGTGPYSRQQTVTTKQSTPGSIDKRAIQIKSVGSDRFTTTWMPPCYTNGNIFKYNLIVYNLDDGDVAQQLNTRDTRLRMEHLKPFSNYTVSVAAVNDAGQGQYTNGSVVRTSVGVPRSVEGLNVVDVKATNITVAWTTPDTYTGPTAYKITVHDLYYTLSESFTIDGFNRTNHTIRELRPFWSYSISIETVTSAGASDAITTDVKTAESVPGPVQHLQLHPETDVTRLRTVNVTWQPPSVEDRHGIIKHYHVRYIDTRNFEYHEIVRNTTKSLNIKGVVPGSIKVQLTAETGPGEGDIYAASVTLKPGAPLKRDESVSLLMTSPTANISDGRTQIAVQLPLHEFLCNDSNGEPVYWGLIVAGSSHAKDMPFFGPRLEFEKKKYKTWFDFRDSGRADPYITTDMKWNPCDSLMLGNGRQRRSVANKDSTTYIVGIDGACKDKEPKDSCNGELKPGFEYRVRSFVCTVSGCTETEYSEPIATVAIPVEETVSDFIPALAGGVGAAILLLILIPVVYLHRSRKGCFRQKATGTSNEHRGDERQNDETFALTNQRQPPFKPGPVNRLTFELYVAAMHIDGNQRFSEAFKLLNETSPTSTTSVAKMQANRRKNRVPYYVTFDDSRVKLLPFDDVKGSDYINANYIPGHASRRAYIATQGPMTSTFDDFWRMVWEQNVGTIVMLTKLVEKGRTKCDKYWPDLGKAVFYGDLRASTNSESDLSHYTIRVIELKLQRNTRRIHHFSFLTWPDMRCPEKPSDLLNFVLAVRNEHVTDPSLNGPLVVHSSTGVGRTGTFIAVDHLLQHIRDQVDVDIDIFDLVLEMRRHRCKMVQTEDQFVYIHECLKEFISKYDEGQVENMYENTAKRGGNEQLYVNI